MQRVSIAGAALTLAAALVVGGCSKDDQEPTSSSDAASPGGDGGAGPTVQQQTPGYFPQTLERAIDILFVIDNSGSMGEEQVNLTNNFPKLIEALRNPRLGSDGRGKPCDETDRGGCAIPNVQIGVISADLGAANYTTLPSCEVAGGDKGKLLASPRVAGCTPPSKPFISYRLEGGKGVTNIPGDHADPIEAVKEAFSCIAKLGTAGCGFEQQLEAARRALDPKAKINPGFIRDDALLAVVFITDEDDCSAQNPQLFDPTQVALTDPLGPLTSFRCFEFGVSCDINDRNKLGPRKDCVPSGDWLWDIKTRYVDFLRGLKPPGRVVVAAIAAPADPVEVGKDGQNPVLKQSCQSAMGTGVPAIRIKALVDAFGSDGQFSSICAADFGPALQQLGKKLIGQLGGQCISSPLLTASTSLACQKGDELAPGLTCSGDPGCLHEAACDVNEVVGMGTASERSTPIDRCPTELWYPADWQRERDCSGSCPCWRVVRKEAGDCDPLISGSPYALDILREGDAAKGAVAEMRCLTTPYPWGSRELSRRGTCR